MHVMNIPHLAERLSCVLFKRNFDASVGQIRHHLEMMAQAACEVRGSADFKLLLQHVLAVGNFMNSGTAKGAAQVRHRAFQCHSMPCMAHLQVRKVPCMCCHLVKCHACVAEAGWQRRRHVRAASSDMRSQILNNEWHKMKIC
jgi:hypothetical protein